MTEDLKKRYESMTKTEEDVGQELPTLAIQREKEARERAMRVFAAARELVAKGMLQAAGYRVLVKPIESIVELEAAEAEIAPHLAEQGFEVKTLHQKDVEERGENHGIVVHIGPIAFERHGGRKNWCDEGDTIVFNRYAGTRVEHPPGSKVFYQLMNDEDVYGRIA